MKKAILILLLPILLSGCIIETYDDVGVSGKVKIGGIISYIVDLEISGKVGLTRNNGVTNDETIDDDVNFFRSYL